MKVNIDLIRKNLSSKAKKHIAPKAGNEPVTGWLSTGIYLLDRIISGKKDIGGIPRGKLTEVHGPESVGKSALVYALLAKNQREGGISILFAFEEFDADRFVLAGGSVEDLILFESSVGTKKPKIKEISEEESENGEDRKENDTQDELKIETFFDIAKDISIKAKELYADVPVAIGVDSLNAALSEKEAKLGMEDLQNTQPAWQKAAIMGRGFKKLLQQHIAGTKTAVIWINHLMEKIGENAFIKKEDTPGGRALKFYASLRLQLTSSSTIKHPGDNTPIGALIRPYTRKNKVGPPFRSTVAAFFFHTGRFDNEWSIAHYMLENKIKHPNCDIGKFKEEVKKSKIAKILKKDPGTLRECEELCWEHLESIEKKRRAFIGDTKQDIDIKDTNNDYDEYDEIDKDPPIKSDRPKLSEIDKAPPIKRGRPKLKKKPVKNNRKKK